MFIVQCRFKWFEVVKWSNERRCCRRSYFIQYIEYIEAPTERERKREGSISFLYHMFGSACVFTIGLRNYRFFLFSEVCTHFACVCLVYNVSLLSIGILPMLLTHAKTILMASNLGLSSNIYSYSFFDSIIYTHKHIECPFRFFAPSISFPFSPPLFFVCAFILVEYLDAHYIVCVYNWIRFYGPISAICLRLYSIYYECDGGSNSQRRHTIIYGDSLPQSNCMFLSCLVFSYVRSLVCIIRIHTHTFIDSFALAPSRVFFETAFK